MISILTFVFAALGGVGGIIRGWQMGFKGRLDLISDWDSRPLPDPARFAKAFSRIYIGLGGILIAMSLLLLLGLDIRICIAVAVAVIVSWFYAIDVVVARARATKR